MKLPAMKRRSAVASAAFLLLSAGPLQAGDYYKDCLINNPDYRFDGEELRRADDESKLVKFKTITKFVIQQNEGHCLTKTGKKYGFSGNTSYMEIQLALPDNGGPISILALCEEASSGLPANEECAKEVVTKDRRIVPTYKDIAKKGG